MCYGEVTSFRLSTNIICEAKQGYELKEERRLRVFENRVLRSIFRLKRDKVTGEWRRIHNEEVYAVQASPNTGIIMKICLMGTELFLADGRTNEQINEANSRI